VHARKKGRQQKTDPKRSALYYRRADRARALKALNWLLIDQREGFRWRQVAEWCPANSYARKSAMARAKQYEQRMSERLTEVMRAIGYDPEEEGPPPTTHWDKGAMEDD
jgi:hypothetical protein